MRISGPERRCERREERIITASRSSSTSTLFQTTSSERIRKYDPNLYKKPEIEEMQQLDDAISNRSVKKDPGRLIRETLAYFEWKRPRGAQNFLIAKLD